jgi:hypothetical protein
MCNEKGACNCIKVLKINGESEKAIIKSINMYIYFFYSPSRRKWQDKSPLLLKENGYPQSLTWFFRVKQGGLRFNIIQSILV